MHPVTIRRGARPQRGWMPVEHAIVDDMRLPNRALGLLIRILRRPDNWRTDRESLAKLCGEGVSAIRSQLQELRKAGYLVQSKYQNERGQWMTETVIYDSPQPVDNPDPAPVDNPSTGGGKPTSGATCGFTAKPQVAPAAGKPVVGNPLVGGRASKDFKDVDLEDLDLELKTFTSELADASPDPTPFDLEREDIRKIHDHFNASLVERGCKPKPATKASALAVRRMLDLDKRSVDQVLKCIDWVTADPFWSGNVLSLPKLRERYDQLRLQAQRPPEGLEPSRILEPAGSRSSGWRSQRSGTYRNYQNPRDSSIYLEGL